MIGGRSEILGASSKTTCAFVPPMPKELTPARRGVAHSGQALALVPIKNGLLSSLELRIWRTKIHERGKLAVLQHLDRLDEPCDSGGDVEMADVGFEGSELAEAYVVCPGPENGVEGSELDRVAERRPGAVRLNIGDRAGIYLCERLRRRDDLDLAVDARRGITRLRGAVVVDRAAADDGVDGVPVGHGVGEALQHHDAGASARTNAGGGGVERTAVAVGREDHSDLVAIAGAFRKSDRYAASQRHIAFAVRESPAGRDHGDERRRTRRLDGDAGPAQVQLVGGARAEEVLVVAQHDLIGAHRPCGLGIRCNMLQQVPVHAGAGIDADGEAIGPIPPSRVLQGLVGAFEEHALLRVDELRLAR